ncbi:MAG: copper-binding protein [Candidatus Eremiobacteraeota bacterium]|nr:copper-binding protein [Candidatus Eremiobacteraeota bacterium]
MKGFVLALGLALSAILAGAALAGQPSAAQMHVYGTVVSVDRGKSTLVLQHAALETMPAGRHKCRLRHSSDGSKLKPGSTIEASADTRHNPWTLDAVRILN